MLTNDLKIFIEENIEHIENKKLYLVYILTLSTSLSYTEVKQLTDILINLYSEDIVTVYQHAAFATTFLDFWDQFISSQPEDTESIYLPSFLIHHYPSQMGINIYEMVPLLDDIFKRHDKNFTVDSDLYIRRI